MQSTRINLGHFDLNNLRVDEANQLLAVMLGFAGMQTGATLAKNCSGVNAKMNLRDKKEYEFTLSGNIEYVRNFNAKSMDPDNAKVLKSFLQPCHAGKIFMPGACIIAAFDADVTQEKFYAFVNYLGILVGEDSYGELVLHIFDPKIYVNGGSAQTHQQIGTVRYRLQDERRLIYEPSRVQRIVRIQGLEDRLEHVKIMQREFGKSKLFPHLGVRAPIFFTSPNKLMGQNREVIGRHSAVVMKLLKEKDLFDVIHEDVTSQPMPLEDRKDLTLELMVKLKTELHMKKLRHRDIKPENIRAVRKVSGSVCHYIDVTDVLPMTLEDGRDCGTPHYLPKEMFENHSSQKSDIFSLGMTLARIWRDTSQNEIDLLSNYPYAEAYAKIRSAREANNWQIDLELFAGIDGLEDSLAFRIKKLLTAMTAVEPELRPDIQTCIDVFEDIYLTFRSAKLRVSERPVVLHAFKIAKQCRLQLEKDSLKNLRSIDNLNYLIDSVIGAINFINDTEPCVHEFVLTSKLECLWGSRSKLELQMRLKAMSGSFFSALGQLEQIKTQMCEIYSRTDRGDLTTPQIEKRKTLSQEIRNIELFKQKIFAAPLDMNIVNELIDKVNHKVGKLNSSLIYFEELQAVNREIGILK